MVEIKNNGRVVSTSKNLRAITAYAAKGGIWVDKFTLTQGYDGSKEQGLLRVEFNDGAVCETNFRSYHIMVDWVRNRRSMRGALREFVNGPDMGYLTKPGIIAGT